MQGLNGQLISPLIIVMGPLKGKWRRQTIHTPGRVRDNIELVL